jgi:hypothetical protein
MDDALLGARQSAVRSPAAQSSGQRGRRGVGETGWFHPGFSPRKNPTETPTGGFGPPDRGQADGAVMLESRETLGIRGKGLAPRHAFAEASARSSSERARVGSERVWLLR